MISDLFQLVVSPEISQPNNEADMEVEVKVHTLPPDKELPYFISHFCVLLDFWLYSKFRLPKPLTVLT
jgi:hypothetical protein